MLMHSIRWIWYLCVLVLCGRGFRCSVLQRCRKVSHISHRFAASNQNDSVEILDDSPVFGFVSFDKERDIRKDELLKDVAIDVRKTFQEQSLPDGWDDETSDSTGETSNAQLETMSVEEIMRYTTNKQQMKQQRRLDALREREASIKKQEEDEGYENFWERMKRIKQGSPQKRRLEVTREYYSLRRNETLLDRLSTPLVSAEDDDAEKRSSKTDILQSTTQRQDASQMKRSTQTSPSVSSTPSRTTTSEEWDFQVEVIRDRDLVQAMVVAMVMVVIAKVFLGP